MEQKRASRRSRWGQGVKDRIISTSYEEQAAIEMLEDEFGIAYESLEEDEAEMKEAIREVEMMLWRGVER